MLADRIEGKWIDAFCEVFERCAVEAGDTRRDSVRDAVARAQRASGRTRLAAPRRTSRSIIVRADARAIRIRCRCARPGQRGGSARLAPVVSGARGKPASWSTAPSKA